MLAVLFVAPPGVQCGMERDLAVGRPGKLAGLRIERRDQSRHRSFAVMFRWEWRRTTTRFRQASGRRHR